MQPLVSMILRNYLILTRYVDSIRKLAQKSDEFARTSLEFLVDMFNDEIDSIRINSLNSVTHMGTNIQLNDEQVRTLKLIILCQIKSINYFIILTVNERINAI